MDICPRTLSVPRSEQPVRFELRGTDNVQGQISWHIFAPNGGYCLYYPSNIFRDTRGFKNWGISSDMPQFWLGNIRSRDAFRPIAREQKYLMDYKNKQTKQNEEKKFKIDLFSWHLALIS